MFKISKANLTKAADALLYGSLGLFLGKLYELVMGAQATPLSTSLLTVSGVTALTVAAVLASGVIRPR